MVPPWLLFCVVYMLAASQLCSSLTCKTTEISVGGTLTESEFDTDISTSGVITTGPHYNLRGPINIGYSKVTFTVCLEAGKWKVAGYITTPVLNDLTLVITGSKVDPQPRNGKRGYGIFVPKVTSTTLFMDTAVCVKVPTTSEKVLGVTSFLNSIPWPGKYTGISQFVIGLGISAIGTPTPKYKCGRLGVQRTFAWKLNSKTGVATLTLPLSGHYVQNSRATWQNPCSGAFRYCSTSHDQTVVVAKGAVGKAVTG